MSNLFANAIDQSVVLKREALKRNTEFVLKLVNDLQNVLNVHVESERRNQDEIKYTVYSLDQQSRYGWGSSFTASSDGVLFHDERGSYADFFMRLIGMSETETQQGKTYRENFITSPYETVKTAFPIQWSIAEQRAQTLGVKIKPGNCYGSNNGLNASIILSQENPKLNDSLKIIIKLLMHHGITTK